MIYFARLLECILTKYLSSTESSPSCCSNHLKISSRVPSIQNKPTLSKVINKQTKTTLYPLNVDFGIKRHIDGKRENPLLSQFSDF